MGKVGNGDAGLWPAKCGRSNFFACSTCQCLHVPMSSVHMNGGERATGLGLQGNHIPLLHYKGIVSKEFLSQCDFLHGL